MTETVTTTTSNDTQPAATPPITIQLPVKPTGGPAPSWLLTPDGRRALAFAAIVGGCIIFTLFAGFGVLMLRNDAQHSFYLALAAHAQILIGMTGLAALLTKRSIKVGKDGVDIQDLVDAIGGTSS